jgi:autotransporter-associated beta strand protein
MATAAGQTATLNIDSANAGVTQGTAANAFRVAESGTAVVNQSAGTVNVSNYLTIGENLSASGTYNISGGVLNVKTNNGAPPANSGAAGSNNLVVGRLGTGNLNISGTATVNVLNGAQVMLGMGTNNSNQFQGFVPNAALSTGGGTITQTGGSVNVAVNNGIYQPNALGVVGGVIIAVDGAGTYTLNGGTLTTPILARGNGTATFNLGGGTLKAAAPVATLSAPLFNVDLPINLTGIGAGKGIIDTNGNDATVTGALGGAGGFVKAGTGTLNVLGAGAYAGGTDINTGKVVASGTSLGTGVVSIGSGSTLEVQGVQQGLLARFYLANTTGVTPGVANGNAANVGELSSLESFNAFVLGKPMVAAESTAARGKVSVNYLDNGGNGGVTALPAALVQINGGNNFVAHLAGKFDATLAGDYTFQARSDDATVIWIDGKPVLDNNRAQGNTTRTGTIELTAGQHDIVIGYQQGGGGATLSVGVTQPGQGQSFTIGGELNMSNSLLSYGSNDLTVGGLSGTGAVQMAAGILKVIAGSGSNDFGGVITGGASGTFVKDGASTQILSGNSTATFTGNTNIDGGKLLVTGSFGGGGTSVNNGGTLGGTGDVGPVTVNSGGTVAPGNTLGDLTVASATFGAGSAFSLELNGTGAGTTYDQLSIASTGSISILGGNITLSLGFAPTSGQQFTVIDNLTANPISGTFSNLPNGGIVSATFGATSYNFVANYAGGTGNDLVLTVPEPTSATALLAGLTLAAGLRRFRRKA